MSTSTVATAALILSFKSLMSATGVRYTQSFTYPHRKKSQGVISGDLAGQEMGPARQIYRFGKCWLRDARTIKLQCGGSETSLDLYIRFRFDKPLHALCLLLWVHGDWADSQRRIECSGKQRVPPRTQWNFESFSRIWRTNSVPMSFHKGFIHQ
jgi:hypothetical protein